MSKSPEAFPIEVHRKRLVTDNENIDSEIEFFAANQKRIHDVPLHYVWFCLGTLRLPSELIFPLGNVLKFVEQENTFSLTLADRLHNPDLASSFEFFDKETIIARQIVSGGEEVILISLGDLALSLQLLLVPLQVLHHQILPGQLVVVPVMIYALMRLQMTMVHDVVDLVSFDPKDVPVISLHLLVTSFPEGF